jgi:hypothetical protein
MRGSVNKLRSGPKSGSSNSGPTSRRQGSGSGFVIGRDSRGRWTALAAGGLIGGVFRSKDAAIRYAQAEAGPAPDAVRLTASPLELPFTRNQIGRGEGLPAWWRLDRATRGAKSFAERMPIMGDVDRRWLAIDLGLVAGLGALCLAVALLLS